MTDLLKAADLQDVKYSYKNPACIESLTGFIGYMRQDYGSTGEDFYTTFYDGPFKKEANEQNFIEAFGMLVDTIRTKMPSLNEMKSFCRNNKGAAVKGLCCEEYVFTKEIDDTPFIFIIRFIPSAGSYNMYIYCYFKEHYLNHIWHAAKNIRFITPQYREVFRIPDNGKIKITYSDGTTDTRVCRYIDEYHTLIGTNSFHICEWAEKMVAIGAHFEPADIENKEE